MTTSSGPIRIVQRGRGGRGPSPWARLASCLALLVFSVAFAAGSLFSGVAAQEGTPAAEAMADDPVAAARERVALATAHVTEWDGPTTGPAAQPGKNIVYVSTDQRNGGAAGVGKGVEEAAAALGWNLTVMDGQGTVTGQSSVLSQAIALQPDGIILGAVDFLIAISYCESVRMATCAVPSVWSIT